MSNFVDRQTDLVILSSVLNLLGCVDASTRRDVAESSLMVIGCVCHNGTPFTLTETN